MYGIPPDLIADCIRAYSLHRQLTGPAHFLYKHAAGSSGKPSFHFEAFGLPGYGPTPKFTITRGLTSPIPAIIEPSARVEAPSGITSAAKATPTAADPSVSAKSTGSEVTSGSGKPQGSSGPPGAETTSGTEGRGGSDGSRGPATPSLTEDPSGPDGPRDSDNKPPASEDGSKGLAAIARYIRRYTPLALGLLAGGGAIGYWLTGFPYVRQNVLSRGFSHWTGIPSSDELSELHDLQLEQSAALPWLAGGLAALWRYLTHDEEDESDPLGAALKVGLLAWLGTEAFRQYSSLRSLGVSQPLPKMIQHLGAQFGLMPEPNWMRNLNENKYKAMKAKLIEQLKKQQASAPQSGPTPPPQSNTGSAQTQRFDSD
jgi:hypothetical protein